MPQCRSAQKAREVKESEPRFRWVDGHITEHNGDQCAITPTTEFDFRARAVLSTRSSWRPLTPVSTERCERMRRRRSAIGNGTVRRPPKG